MLVVVACEEKDDKALFHQRTTDSCGDGDAWDGDGVRLRLVVVVIVCDTTVCFGGDDGFFPTFVLLPLLALPLLLADFFSAKEADAAAAAAATDDGSSSRMGVAVRMLPTKALALLLERSGGGSLVVLVDLGDDGLLVLVLVEAAE